MILLKTPMFVTVIVILALGGCASKRQESSSFMIPEIGSVTTKGVGEELVTQGTGKLQPTLIILEDGMIGTVALRKGRYSSDRENSTRIRFVRDGKDVVYLYKEDNKICLSRDECGGPSLKYTLEMALVSQSLNSFQKTLLYNGKIGNRITLGYREFTDGMAKPAFSNEVAYDLSESTILGYKGARIEIIKATNTDITYKFLSGFKD